MFSARKKDEINLLPQRGLESNTVGRLLAWVLSSFRVIVIVTEIIVMVAFLSRFWLDAQNADLNDEIKNKKAVLEAYQDFESNFRDAKARLELYSSISSGGTFSSLFKSISDLLPPDIYLASASYAGGFLTLSAVSTNELSIQQFIVNVNSIDRLKNIYLKEVQTEKDNPNLIKFVVNMTVNNI